MQFALLRSQTAQDTALAVKVLREIWPRTAGGISSISESPLPLPHR